MKGARILEKLEMAFLKFKKGKRCHAWRIPGRPLVLWGAEINRHDIYLLPEKSTTTVTTVYFRTNVSP